MRFQLSHLYPFTFLSNIISLTYNITIALHILISATIASYVVFITLNKKGTIRTE